MWIQSLRTDIAHELSFGSPQFELPAKAISLLDALYKVLATEARPISPADLISVGGQRYSDVSIRVNLPNGHVSVTPDKVTCELTALQSQVEFDAAIDNLRDVETTLVTVFPELTFKARRAIFAAWLECEGGMSAATQALAILTPARNLAPSVFTKEGVVGKWRVSGNFIDEAEKFHSRFDLEESFVTGTQLFMRLDTTIAQTSEFFFLDKTRQKMGEQLASILASIGAHAKTPDEAAPNQ